MKKNNIFTGLVLILLAGVMMASAMGILPDIHWFKLLAGIAFVAWSVKALFRRDFFGAFTSAGILAWIFENELGIEELTPFPLLIAAALVGIGMNMIFGKKKRHFNVNINGENMTIDEARAQSKWEDGRHVVLENIFGSTSKYVNSAAFSTADLENVFGNANIYFDNAVMANGTATVKIENVFGQMNVYFPNTWRVNVKDESAFGHVNVIGEPNRDMDAPFAEVEVETVFGNTNIYFE